MKNDVFSKLSYCVKEVLSEDAVREGLSWSIRTNARSDKNRLI